MEPGSAPWENDFSGSTGAPVKKRMGLASWIRLFWFLSILVCPFFGYYLTGISGWVNMESWPSAMYLRIGICLGIPVGFALLLTLASMFDRSGSGLSMNNAVGHIVFSAICGFPAWNAYRDLGSGPETTTVVVTHKEETEHRNKHKRWSSYELRFADGRSYAVDKAVYQVARVEDRHELVRLPHTDILLDLRPVH